MRLLVTRPAEDAAPLARLLEERGHQVMLEPLLDIVPLDKAEIDLNSVQALLFTSANGVRAFARRMSERQMKVFAVGDASARAALDAGFASVDSARGDVADLARLVIVHCDPAQGALLHPAASQVAGDLAGLLGDAGFVVRRAVIYESRAAKALSAPTVASLQTGSIDGMLFFSPRTAESFVSLAAEANITDRLASVTAYALSQAVADCLNGLTFKAVRIASQPDQEALLTCIDEGPMTSDVETSQSPVSENKPAEAAMPLPMRKAKRALTAFLVGGVLGIALVAGAGALLWPLLVDSLKSEIMQGEAEPDPAAVVNSDAIRALNARDESLSRRIADLEAKPALPVEKQNGMAPEAVEHLNERLAKLEHEVQAVSTRRETGPSMLVAALMLREAGKAGRPFATELEMLAKLGEADAVMAPHLAALKPLNANNIVSQDELEKRFHALKPALMRSTLDENEDLWTGIKRRLAVLISIRRTDSQGQEASGLDGAVTRAETALINHDLAGAVAILTTLAGPAGELVKPWLGDAYTHIEADQHILAVLDRALALTVKP